MRQQWRSSPAEGGPHLIWQTAVKHPRLVSFESTTSPEIELPPEEYLFQINQTSSAQALENSVGVRTHQDTGEVLASHYPLAAKSNPLPIVGRCCDQGGCLPSIALHTSCPFV